MRDPARIDRIAEKLRQVWHSVPDWRLGQLVSNLMGAGRQDVFHPEDAEWETWLDLQLKLLNPVEGPTPPKAAPAPGIPIPPALYEKLKARAAKK